MRMGLTPVENYVEAIRFGSPEYLPRGDEPIFHTLGLTNNCRMETWTDDWGTGWVSEMPGTVPFPKHNPLPDITKLDDYILPNPDDLFAGLEDEKIKMHTAKKEGRLVLGGYTYFLFERAWALMGLEPFMIALAEEPERMHALLHKIAVFVRRVFENMLEAGVDGVSFSEDLGTQRALMFSPAYFDTFFAPEYRFIFEDVLRNGKMVHFHSCGCIESIAEKLADMGVTVLNPVQARANDIASVKRTTFGKTALSGAIDSHLLLVGTVDEVKRETARVIEIMKPGGGYICTPDQGFPHYPPENIAAMYQTAVDLGRY